MMIINHFFVIGVIIAAIAILIMTRFIINAMSNGKHHQLAALLASADKKITPRFTELEKTLQSLTSTGQRLLSEIQLYRKATVTHAAMLNVLTRRQDSAAKAAKNLHIQLEKSHNGITSKQTAAALQEKRLAQLPRPLSSRLLAFDDLSDAAHRQAELAETPQDTDNLKRRLEASRVKLMPLSEQIIAISEALSAIHGKMEKINQEDEVLTPGIDADEEKQAKK